MRNMRHLLLKIFDASGFKLGAAFDKVTEIIPQFLKCVQLKN